MQRRIYYRIEQGNPTWLFLDEHSLFTAVVGNIAWLQFTDALLLIHVSHLSTPCLVSPRWRHPFNGLSVEENSVPRLVDRASIRVCERAALKRQDAIKKSGERVGLVDWPVLNWKSAEAVSIELILHRGSINKRWSAGFFKWRLR